MPEARRGAPGTSSSEVPGPCRCLEPKQDRRHRAVRRRGAPEPDRPSDRIEDPEQGDRPERPAPRDRGSGPIETCPAHPGLHRRAPWRAPDRSSAARPPRHLRPRTPGRWAPRRIVVTPARVIAAGPSGGRSISQLAGSAASDASTACVALASPGGDPRTGGEIERRDVHRSGPCPGRPGRPPRVPGPPDPRAARSRARSPLPRSRSRISSMATDSVCREPTIGCQELRLDRPLPGNAGKPDLARPPGRRSRSECAPPPPPSAPRRSVSCRRSVAPERAPRSRSPRGALTGASAGNHPQEGGARRGGAVGKAVRIPAPSAARKRAPERPARCRPSAATGWPAGLTLGALPSRPARGPMRMSLMGTRDLIGKRRIPVAVSAVRLRMIVRNRPPGPPSKRWEGAKTRMTRRTP